jgi:phage I-like protein
MRHNNEDELVEIADDDGRDELVAEITALYEKNIINPTPSSVELEKALRIYLETADSLLDARNETEEEVLEQKLDELELIIPELRVAIEAGFVDGFIIPGNDTIH